MTHVKYIKHIKQGLCLVIVFSAGCSGSDYRSGSVASPPGANSVDFTAFVQGQFVTPPAANERATPVEVENTQFTFADQDDPTAFDFIISNAP